MKKYLFFAIVFVIIIATILPASAFLDASSKLIHLNSDNETRIRMYPSCIVNSSGIGNITEINFVTKHERPRFKSYWIEYGNDSISHLERKSFIYHSGTSVSNQHHTIILIGLLLVHLRCFPICSNDFSATLEVKMAKS